MSLRSLEYAATLIVEPRWAWLTAAMNVETRRVWDDRLPHGLLKWAPGSGSQAAALEGIAAPTVEVSRPSATRAPSRLSMGVVVSASRPERDRAPSTQPPGPLLCAVHRRARPRRDRPRA